MLIAPELFNNILIDDRMISRFDVMLFDMECFSANRALRNFLISPLVDVLNLKLSLIYVSKRSVYYYQLFQLRAIWFSIWNNFYSQVNYLYYIIYLLSYFAVALLIQCPVTISILYQISAEDTNCGGWWAFLVPLSASRFSRQSSWRKDACLSIRRTACQITKKFGKFL
jgi:ABC-type bacteriocin/lantibiotic exporter with double-glycine peptidase domain